MTGDEENDHDIGNKACPFCAETIKAAAVYCKYCHRDLPTPAAQSSVGVSSTPAAATSPLLTNSPEPSSTTPMPAQKKTLESLFNESASGLKASAVKSWPYLIALLLVFLMSLSLHWAWLTAIVGSISLVLWPVCLFACFVLPWRHKLLSFCCSGLSLVLFCVAVGSSQPASESQLSTSDKTIKSPTQSNSGMTPSEATSSQDSNSLASKSSETSENPASSKEPVVPPDNIGCTNAQFVQRFNDLAYAENMTLRMKRSKEKSGRDIIYSIGPNMAVTLFEDVGAKKVKSVMFCGQGDNTFLSGAQVLFAMGFLMTAADPTIGPDQRHEIMTDLHVFSDDGNPTIDGTSERNGLKYAVSTSQVFPVLFTISKITE